MWKNGDKKKEGCLKGNSGSCISIKCSLEVMYSKIRGKGSIMKVILALKGTLWEPPTF
jgi:hypothetical protein